MCANGSVSDTFPTVCRGTRGILEFRVDPAGPDFKDFFARDKRFVFRCASGWRSALSVSTLKDMGFEASPLKERVSTWRDQGGPVEFPEKKQGLRVSLRLSASGQ